MATVFFICSWFLCDFIRFYVLFLQTPF